MNKLYLGDFNLHKTLIGGQSFAWTFDGEYYWGVESGRVMKVKLEDTILNWETYPYRGDEDYIKRYFRADVNYDIISRSISHDLNVQKARSELGNIRLIKQDFAQTLISFLVSSNNSIKSIRTRLLRFSSVFGELYEIEGHKIHTFPTIERICSASEEELRSVGLGYRTKFVKNAAVAIKNGELTEQMLIVDEDFARKLLMGQDGIGDKVADCVLVFGLGYDDIMPLDRWGRRILEDLYGHDANSSYEFLRNWVKKQYGGYASWASQSLFEWYRK